MYLLKNYISAVIYSTLHKAIIGKGKKYPFKKNILVSGKKNNKQGTFLHNYFKNLLKNVNLPGKLSILCNSRLNIYIFFFIPKQNSRKIGRNYIASSDFLEICLCIKAK